MLPLRVRVLPLRLRKLWLGVLPLWVLLRLRKLRLLAIEVARVTAPVLEVNGTAVWGSRSPGPRQHGRQHKEPHTTIKHFYLEHRRDNRTRGYFLICIVDERDESKKNGTETRRTSQILLVTCVCRAK